MEALKQSISDLEGMFHNRMNQFQAEVSEKASPTSSLASDFTNFKSFVLTALKNLQLQVGILAKQLDSMEMRSRRKMLLVHGIPECQSEDSMATITKVVSEQLKIPHFSKENIDHCQRLGLFVKEKPRPILIKFREVSTRDQIWYSKKGLKSSGITLSEFLTKTRHEAFMSARTRFGISQCWTRGGTVFIVGPDKKKYSAVCPGDLNAIPTSSTGATSAPISKTVTPENNSQPKTSRTKKAAVRK